MGRATPDPGTSPVPREGVSAAWLVCREVAVFTLGVAVLSGLLSFIALPWINLPWWRIFRRCVSIATVIVLWVILSRSHRSLRSVGLVPWREGKGLLSLGAVIGLLTPLLLVSAYLVLGICRVELHPDVVRVWRTTLVFLPGAGLVALLEEFIFRGYLLRVLWDGSKLLAVAGSSLAYGLVHLRPNVGWNINLPDVIGLTILGLVLASITLQTKQLSLAIGLHAGLAYWARVNKLFLSFSPESARWLVGDNRLINGVITWCVLICVGLAIGIWCSRTRVNVEGGR